VKYFLVFTGIQGRDGGLDDARIIAAPSREAAVLSAFAVVPRNERLMAVCELPQAPVYYERDARGGLTGAVLAAQLPRLD
jgi:hypothetical protein